MFNCVQFAVVFSICQTSFIPAYAVTVIPLASKMAVSAATPENVQTDRGGTINRINWKNKTMLVDGVMWTLSPNVIKLTEAVTKKSQRVSDAMPTSLSMLKPGMQIRFVTTRKKTASASSADQILALTVLSALPAR